MLLAAGVGVTMFVGLMGITEGEGVTVTIGVGLDVIGGVGGGVVGGTKISPV